MAKQEGMVKKQKEIYLQAMRELQSVWHDNYEQLQKLHGDLPGIRSSQIGALVILLIKKGILK